MQPRPWASAPPQSKRYEAPVLAAAVLRAADDASGTQVCRKMGIMKWPYQKLKPIQRKLERLRSQVWRVSWSCGSRDGPASYVTDVSHRRGSSRRIRQARSTSSIISTFLSRRELRCSKVKTSTLRTPCDWCLRGGWMCTTASVNLVKNLWLPLSPTRAVKGVRVCLCCGYLVL